MTDIDSLTNDRIDAAKAREEILSLARQLGQKYPKNGWDEICGFTGFHEKVMEITGTKATHFVDCLEAVGMTRFQVVNAMTLAKPCMHKTANRYRKPEATETPKQSTVAVQEPVRQAFKPTSNPIPTVVSPAVPERDSAAPKPRKEKLPARPAQIQLGLF